MSSEKPTLRQLVTGRFGQVDKNLSELRKRLENLQRVEDSDLFGNLLLKLKIEGLEESLNELEQRVVNLEKWSRLSFWLIRQVAFLVGLAMVAWLLGLCRG